jgi:hypothetical protein
VKVFSLPHVGDDKTRRHIDLGVRDPAQVEPAFEKMQEGCVRCTPSIRSAA